MPLSLSVSNLGLALLTDAFSGISNSDTSAGVFLSPLSVYYALTLALKGSGELERGPIGFYSRARRACVNPPHAGMSCELKSSPNPNMSMHDACMKVYPSLLKFQARALQLTSSS